MIRALWPLGVVLAATWHAWRWYLNRIALVPEEGAALLLCASFVAATAWRERDQLHSTPLWRSVDVAVPAGFLLAYAMSFSMAMPPIGRAALAVCAAAACLYQSVTGRRAPAALFVLAALSLPVLPSLQMTFGYGLRVVSAAMTAAMLQAQGLAVSREGTFLVWRGETVQFDSPCSGVNMVWAGVLIALMGSIALRLPAWRAAAAVAAGGAFAVMGNVLRASSLFYVEAGFVGVMPSYAHEAMGLTAFALCAAAIAWVLRELEPARESEA